MRAWDPYHLWSSLTSNQFWNHIEKRKDQREKQASIRGWEVETRTHWQICHWQWWWPSVICSSHISLPCRDTRTAPRVDTHKHQLILQRERGVKKTYILVASLKCSRLDRSLLPPPLCCSSPCLCFYISICGSLEPAAMHEAPGPLQKADNMRQTIMPQWTSHLSLPARISHLLWPSVRKSYVLVSYEAADIQALTQAPPHCPWREYMHVRMNAVMPLISPERCSFRGSKAMFVG